MTTEQLIENMVEEMNAERVAVKPVAVADVVAAWEHVWFGVTHGWKYTEIVIATERRVYRRATHGNGFRWVTEVDNMMWLETMGEAYDEAVAELDEVARRIK